jgi:hypothetical protein
MAIKDYAARRAEREEEAKWNSDQDAAADRAEQKAAERRATEKKDREERLAYQKTGLSFQNVTFEQWKKQQAEKKAAAEEQKAQEEEGEVRAKAINDKAQKLHDIKFKIRDVSADLLELTQGMTAPFAGMIGLTEQILETRQKEVEMDLDILGNAEARSKMTDDEIAQVENRVGLNTSLGDLEKDIMTKASSGTLKAMSKEEIWNKLKLEGLDTTKMTKEELDELDKRIEGMAAGTEKLSEEGMNKLMQKAGMMDSTLAGWKAKADMFGMALKNPAVMMKMLQASAITMAISFAKDLFGGALKFRKELGLGAVEAATLAVNVKAAEMHTKLMGGDAALIAASASEMVKQFGDTSVFTMAIGQDMAGLAVSTGFGGANAAKLLKSMEGISGASIETNINTLEAWGNLAGAAGVSKKLVLDDIASSTKEFAEFAKDGGENIAEAAVHAAKLGLNLGTVVSIADNLLKFESSIQKEMEAEMLIGKQLNLDRARQLALEGDLDGLMGEVTDNLVSQAEWAEMNVIQRRALADAIGVSAEDMGKMIAGEKTSAQIAEDKQKAEASHMNFQKAMMVAQIALMATQIGLQGILASKSMKAAVARIVSGFMGMGPLGMVLSIAAVGALGVLAAKAAGFAEGGVVGEDDGAVAPSDTVPAMLTPGELVLNAAQQRNVAGSMGGSASSTETNKLLTDTKDQNDQVISELKQARVQHAALMGTLKSAIDRIPMA